MATRSYWRAFAGYGRVISRQIMTVPAILAEGL
jgi:hypothetical protein